MNYIFDGCAALTSDKFNVSHWDVSKVTDFGGMFSGCALLVGGEGTTYNASKVNKEYARIDGGTSNPGYLTYKAN